MNWCIDFVSGSISGICGLIAAYPFDIVKCRMQTSKQEYRNINSSLVKIFREERFIGLFKGISSPLLYQFPINAFLFSEYYRFYRYLDKKEGMGIGLKRYISGMWAGFVVVYFIAPSELLKIQMQNDKTRFIPLKEVAKEIYQRHGIKGFFRGFWVTMNRDCYSFGAYFYIYFQINDYLKAINQFNHFTQFVSGGFAGIVSWIICYPFDPMKTLIQSNKSERNISQYEAFKLIINKHGYAGLFTGMNSVLLMAFIRHGVILKTNDICLSYFHRYL